MLDCHPRLRQLLLIEDPVLHSAKYVSCATTTGLSNDTDCLLSRMVKRELTSPSQPTSSGSGKRSCMAGSEKQAPPLASPVPAEDFEGLHDMWHEPVEISKDAWAVTRCLDDHGDNKTRWTAGHFVAIAMWSGGLEAGIQAAKAIRIFGIWSPHSDNCSDGPLPLSHDVKYRELMDKLWPTDTNRQRECLAWAKRSNPGTPFAVFETAHHHLLRECVGLDLTKFPTVVRPRVKFYGRGNPLVWDSLVTIEQFWDTLAPVLRKHFAPEVDLDSIAQHIQPAASSRSVRATHGINGDFEKHKKAKARERYGAPRGKNRETNIVQADDYQDDDEDFGEGSQSSLKIKVDPASSKDDIGPGRERLDANPDTKDCSSVTARDFRFRPFLLKATTKLREYSSPYGSANDGAVKSVNPTTSTLEKPRSVYHQVINHLYEQTCGISIDQITCFGKKHNSHLALPQAWEEICEYRASNDMRIFGSRDRLPYPRISSHDPPRPNDTLKAVRPVQGRIDHALYQNAEHDLSQFKIFYPAPFSNK